MRDSFVWIVFLLTYCALAFGRVPWLRIDRAGIALVGAAAFLLTGTISLLDAVRAVNFETLILLFGMMVLVAFLRMGGFFERQMILAQRRVQTAHGLLAVVIVLSGVLSAFLVNDVVCLALTPLVARMSRHLRLNPLPHLIALATASNIGSVATVIGNPQNMIIGLYSGISFGRFSARLAPIAVLGLIINYLLVAWVFRETLRQERPAQDDRHIDESKGRSKRRARPAQTWILIKSVTVTLVVIGLFFTDFPKDLVALGAAAFMLIGRVRPEKVYRHIDWALLVMFAALFVVVDVFNRHILSTWNIGEWTFLIDSPVVMLSLVSAFLSNLVSNVPAVMLFQPIISAIPSASQESAWLALAMSSTLAGNLTIIGSVANLTVVENARREGIDISFWDYFRVGFPLTLITLGLGMWWVVGGG